MTTRSSSDLAMRTVSDALGGFLASPPAGTPAEIVELLTLMAGDPGATLPPRIFFEAGSVGFLRPRLSSGGGPFGA